MEHKLEFTIILPVWHGGDFLKNALCSLQHLDFPPDRFEVIVAGAQDDHSSQQMMQTFASESAFETKFVGCSESHRAKMLNAACRAAKGKVLVFTDDDCVLREGWLKSLHEVILREPELGIVGGQDELESSNSAFALALNYVLQSFIGTGGIRRGSGLRTGTYYPKLWNMALPREVAFQVALHTEEGHTQIFNESLEVQEDVELAKRIAQAGKHTVFAPEVLVGHQRDTTFWRFTRRNFEKARTSRSLGTHRLSHSALAAFAIGVLTLFFASFFSSPLRSLFLTVLAVYGFLLLVVSIGGYFHTKRLRVCAMIPVIIVSLYFARGIGYLFPLHHQEPEVHS
jgi:cellulose synthase/poly-beta-1,6-N-acetylglucosamine synthase-like glycosyltransferase